MKPTFAFFLLCTCIHLRSVLAAKDPAESLSISNSDTQTDVQSRSASVNEQENVDKNAEEALEGGEQGNVDGKVVKADEDGDIFYDFEPDDDDISDDDDIFYDTIGDAADVFTENDELADGKASYDTVKSEISKELQSSDPELAKTFERVSDDFEPSSSSGGSANEDATANEEPSNVEEFLDAVAPQLKAMGIQTIEEASQDKAKFLQKYAPRLWKYVKDMREARDPKLTTTTQAKHYANLTATLAEDILQTAGTAIKDTFLSAMKKIKGLPDYAMVLIITTIIASVCAIAGPLAYDHAVAEASAGSKSNGTHTSPFTSPPTLTLPSTSATPISSKSPSTSTTASSSTPPSTSKTATLSTLSIASPISKPRSTTAKDKKPEPTKRKGNHHATTIVSVL